MFDADRPILKSEQDRLGRTTFAKYLARCILDHQHVESLVIGLFGGWGTGKTSLINLTLEELRFASSNLFDHERPIILNFSAWSYSGQHQLIYSFFRRLSSEMRRAAYFNDEKIIHLLELYISFFTHKPVPKALRPKHAWITRWLNRQRTVDETYGWESGRDLTQVKSELNELLAKQQHKLIIFIDNILRLQEEEIIQVFQIIKSMGDFSNTIYVLAMDREPIIQALNRVHHGGGSDYLEKIVQLPFDIPSISKQDLENILLDRLNAVIAIAPIESWESEYWADIYYSTLKYFFKSARDITHYVNTLSFAFNHVKEVVNPVDFFAMTAMQIFEPEVYYGIRDNKDLFTDLADNVYPFDQQKLSEDKIRCDEILNRAKEMPAEIIEQFLIRLFPRLRSIYQPGVPFFHSDRLARKNKRICSLDVFDIYFRLTIPSGTLSDAEVYAILALTDDEEGFALALLRLNQDERIIKFLDLLDSIGIYKIPTENISNVITALMDSADLFPEGEDSLLSFNTAMRIHRIFHQLLSRFEKSEERFEMLKTAIHKATKSIYIVIHELIQQGHEHIESEDTFVPIEYRDITPEQLEQLKKLAVSRILYWVDIGRLSEHPKLLSILFAWKDWGEEDQCRQYVVEMTKEDKGLLAFLGAVFHEEVKEALMTDSPASKPGWKTRASIIENFIDPNQLLPHAKGLFEAVSFEKLRETEQLALLIFLNAVSPSAVKIFPKISN